jgi:fermentation-respiration switch protein FrsA (DUF1100 family)
MGRVVLMLSAVLVVSLSGCGGAGPAPDPFAYAPTKPLNAQTGPPVRNGPIDVREVSYDAADDERVPALFAMPADATEPVPCVIFQGGFGSTTEQAVPVMQVIASKLGAASFTIDVRDQGSRGTAAELDAALHDPHALADVIRGTVSDLRRGLTYLGTRTECDPGRIAFVGFSQGGLLGAMVAGADDRVRATALLATGGDWRLIIGSPEATILPGVAADPDKLAAALKVLAPLEPDRWVARISPRPVLFVNGTRDASTTPAEARSIQNAAGQPKATYSYDGTHDEALSDPRALGRIGEFLQDEFRDGG